MRAPESLSRLYPLCTQSDLLEVEKRRCNTFLLKHYASPIILENYQISFPLIVINTPLEGLKNTESYFVKILVFVVFSLENATFTVLDNEGSPRVFSLSGYHSKVKERFKFSFEREAHDLFSRRVIFLSLRSGRQKPLRDEEETLSALAWARRRGAPVWFSGSEEKCAS